ncbi:MAG: undecaprenyl diphosphate synthase family protein [Planctomycetota bacterium]
MSPPSFKRLPRHVGVIPDGNRRWAEERGMSREEGYAFGIPVGFQMAETCIDLGIEELSYYGFTQDNTKRPAAQTRAFQQAVVRAVHMLQTRNLDLLICGNSDSPMFPQELLPFTRRTRFGKGGIKLNLLVNYSWQWDLAQVCRNVPSNPSADIETAIGSAQISRMDLVIRWGGRRRLSGFLPIQTVYADFYVVDAYWPDYSDQQLYDALAWYETQDVTLGG